MWYYKGEILEDGFKPKEVDHGFVYLIEISDPETGEQKKYIGCKKFWSTRTLPPLKGKKRKRKVTKESDWRKYHSSSETLKKWVKEGVECKRTMLQIVSSQWELNYVENKLIMLSDACLKDEYRNGIVNLRQSLPPKQLKEDFDNGVVDYNFIDLMETL